MSDDFLLGTNAILTVEPLFRDGKVAVYFRVMRSIESIQVVRFIDPDLAMEIGSAFFTAAKRIKKGEESADGDSF